MNRARDLIRQVFEVAAAQMARPGRNPREAAWVCASHIPTFDAEKNFGLADHMPMNRRLPQRPGVAGADQAAGMPGLWDECTPEHPLGATMVSGEGACAAYYRYRRQN